MDVLTPAERKAIAQKTTGVKKTFGVPLTYGESQLRAFARFANYMAEDDVTLPKVDPKNINPEEIVNDLTYYRTRVIKCPSLNCSSNSVTKPAEQEVLYFKQKGKLKLNYICCNCMTMWKN